MAKSGGSGSVGGRRGSVVSTRMTVSEAKSVSTKGKKGSKPTLGTKVANTTQGVTNKPKKGMA